MKQYVYAFCLQKLEDEKTTTVDGVATLSRMISVDTWQGVKDRLVDGRKGDWSFSNLSFLHETEEADA